MSHASRAVPATSALSAEDRRLLDGCLQANPAAWEAFLGRFSGLLAHVVGRTATQRGVQLSAGDRDDIVADVLGTCLHDEAHALRRFAGRSSLPTYLAVIARRVAVRTLLAAAARPAVDSPTARPTEREPGGHLADREGLESLLDRLDADEARLVRLHLVEARSYGEISRITGLPLASIGPILSRAREKLRRMQAG